MSGWRGAAFWALAGALAASIGLNVHLSRRPAAPARPHVGPLAGGPATPGCGGCGTGQGCALAGGGCRMRPLEGVALVASQREALTRACAETCDAQTRLQCRIQSLLRELQGELRKQPPARARALELTEEIGRLRLEFLRRRVESILLVQETLTPEQVAELVGAKAPRGSGSPCGSGSSCEGRGGP